MGGSDKIDVVYTAFVQLFKDFRKLINGYFPPENVAADFFVLAKNAS